MPGDTAAGAVAVLLGGVDGEGVFSGTGEEEGGEAGGECSSNSSSSDSSLLVSLSWLLSLLLSLSIWLSFITDGGGVFSDCSRSGTLRLASSQ